MQRMLTQEVLDATIQRKEDIVNERKQARHRLSVLNRELAEIIATEELLREVVAKELTQIQKHAEIYAEGLEEVRNGKKQSE